MASKRRRGGPGGLHRVLVVLLLALAAGCGRVGYQPLADLSDGGTQGSVRATTCDWRSGPPAFGSLRALTALNGSAEERDPVPVAGGLGLVFVSSRNGTYDVFRASRPDLASEFGPPAPDKEPTSPWSETRYSETEDGLEAVLASDRPGGPGPFDVFSATRADPGLPFGSFLPVPNVDGLAGDFDALIGPDLLTMWLSSDTGVGMQQDLVFATRPTRAEPFGAPVAASELNSTANDADPSFTGDGRVIVFSSNRTGTNRVYYAIRDGASGPFGPPTLVPGLDPSVETDDPTVSADGCSLYFSTTSLAGLGLHDLYVLEAR